MTEIRNSKRNLWKIVSLALGVVLVLSLIVNIGLVQLVQKGKIFDSIQAGSVNSSLVNPVRNDTSNGVKPVLTQDIYPLFFCPCCGQPLDPNNICCGAMKERIDYIDSLVSQNLSEKEVILSFVKKYGLNSFIDENKAKELKEELLKTAPADRPIISIAPDSYDFGDVSQKAGKVYAYFALKNEGKSDLAINRMDTSCGCTFVAIVYKDKESPFFTMPGHGYENPDWEGISIPAGETAQLKVMYDPDVHKDFRGFAIREINIYSNDSIDFEKKIKIELNQIP